MDNGGGESGGLEPLAVTFLQGLRLLRLGFDLLLGGSAFGEEDLILEGDAVSDSSRRRRPEARAATGEPPMEDPLPEDPELD